MKFSIAICTWNRADLLERTLDSICRMQPLKPEEWEIVLVNNNSTDRTPLVIEQFRERLPLRSFDEPRQGHALARNSAIDECRGAITLWTDDDVSVGAHWLTAYAEATSQTPDGSFWGGPIRPRFDAARPRWLDENWDVCRGCFATRDLGSTPFEFTRMQLPYGANFAVRTDLLRQFRFDERRGHRPDRLIGDDELDLMRRLISAGYTGFWVPEASVEHLIPPDRMTLDYLRRYFVGQGYRIAAAGTNANRSAGSFRREAFVHRNLFRLKYGWTRSPVWIGHWIHSGLAEGQYRFRKESAASHRPVTRK